MRHEPLAPTGSSLPVLCFSATSNASGLSTPPRNIEMRPIAMDSPISVSHQFELPGLTRSQCSSARSTASTSLGSPNPAAFGSLYAWVMASIRYSAMYADHTLPFAELVRSA